MDRRHLLRLAVASAGGLWLPRSAWSQPRWASDPFALGVASGSPEHDSVVLWTRLVAPDLEGAARAPVTLRWEVAHDEAFTRIVQHGQVQAVAELALSGARRGARTGAGPLVFLPLHGRRRHQSGGPHPHLSRPRPRSRACGWAMPRASAGSTATTAPGATCARKTWTRCCSWATTSTNTRAPSMRCARATGGWVTTLDDYRQRYALYKSDADPAGHARGLPLAGDLGRPRGAERLRRRRRRATAAAVAILPARRAAAYQAFYEHMPLRASVLTQALAGLARGAEMRIYSKCRSAGWPRSTCSTPASTATRRSAHGAAAGLQHGRPRRTCAGWNDPRRSYLGAAAGAVARWRLARLGGSVERDRPADAVRAARLQAGPGPALLERWLGRLHRGPFPPDRFAAAPAGLPTRCCWAAMCTRTGSAMSRPTTPMRPVRRSGVEFCGTSITSRSGGNARPPSAWPRTRTSCLPKRSARAMAWPNSRDSD